MSAPTIMLDEAIVAALPVPTGSKIVSVTRHGETNWSTRVKVDVAIENETKSFFVKLIKGEENVGMAEAEYEGQKALVAIIPDHIIAPISWGYYQRDRTKAWFLTHFCELDASAPDQSKLLSAIKKLHLHQDSISPTGKFGFHVTPFFGPPPMVADRTDNWEEFWTREFRSALKYAQRMRGKDAELQQIADEFIDKVVPRLLQPLQTGGRRITPTLCHGDLWDGNIQLDDKTKELVLSDPCPFYGHREMDLKCMRSGRHTLGGEFVKRYGEEVGVSEPVEDFDDRNALYAVRNEILTAGMYSERAYLLEKAKKDMRHLLAKHPRGLAGFEGCSVPTRVEKPESNPTWARARAAGLCTEDE